MGRRAARGTGAGDCRPGALGQIRAWFLTTAGWGDYPTVVVKLAERDERLREAVGKEPIVAASP